MTAHAVKKQALDQHHVGLPSLTHAQRHDVGNAAITRPKTRA